MRNRRDLEQFGFQGFETIAKLRERRCEQVPKQPGVYAIIRESDDCPAFSETSTGGHFKGKNPTVPTALLVEKWCASSRIVYLGKAGGTQSGAHLRQRLWAYLRFGGGAPVGHWGGRYLWQLPQTDELLVAWKPVLDREPRQVEAELLGEFRVAHGSLPFANISS